MEFGILDQEELITILGIQKILSSEGIDTTILYDSDLGQHYIDLDTRAKSHLYLYQDRTLRGRYGYEVVIEETDRESLTRRLCLEFVDALYGRDYYNEYWAELCKRTGINI